MEGVKFDVVWMRGSLSLIHELVDTKVVRYVGIYVVTQLHLLWLGIVS